MWTTSILTSWSFFHADKYQKLLGEVRHATFSTDATILDQSQIRTVSFEVAHKRAEELLGATPAWEASTRSATCASRSSTVTRQGNRIWSLRLLKAGAASWGSGAINSD